MRHPLRPLVLIALFYLCVAKLAHTLLITGVTSYVLLTAKNGTDLPNTVNEISSQFVFFSYALGALLVSLTLWFGNRALYGKSSFWNEGKKKFWELSREIKTNLSRGAGSALLIVLLLVLLLLATGDILYLGLYITSAIGTAVFPLYLMDVLSLVTFIFCEEYIFRYRLLGGLQQILPPTYAVAGASLAYVLIKWIQFDLTAIDILNLLLLNATLGVFYLRTGRVHRGLSFVLVFYGVLHSFLGLPLFSQQGSSFLLLKHNAQTGSAWLTGADAGPLGGLAMTSLLLLLFAGALWSWRTESR